MTPVDLLRFVAIFSIYSLSGLILPFIVLLWFVNYGRLLLWFYRFITPLCAFSMIWYAVHYTFSHLSLHATMQANFASLWWTASICMAYLVCWGLTTFFHVGPPKWFLLIAELQLQTTLKRHMERGCGDEWIQTYRRRVEERREWAAKAFHLSTAKKKIDSQKARHQTNSSQHRQNPRWDMSQMEEMVRNNSRRTYEQHNSRVSKEQGPPSNNDFRNGRVSWAPLGKHYSPNPYAYKDIFGMEYVISEVERSISIVVNNMNLVREYDAKMSTGILMYGPPGTGKTALARAVAEYMGLYFISVRPSDLMGTLVGATQQNIAALFKEAKEHAPSVIFFDELDAIGAKRGSSHMYHDQTLTQLLLELDGFEQRDRVFVLAATNRLEMLDEALVRDGRFGTKLYVPTPDQDTIAEMFWTWSSVLDFDDGVYPIEVAMNLEGQNGATIRGLVERLKRIAMDKRLKGIVKPQITRNEVYREIAQITGKVAEWDFSKTLLRIRVK